MLFAVCSLVCFLRVVIVLEKLCAWPESAGILHVALQITSIVGGLS